MNKHDINNEASVGIFISTFLGTVALFFTGILISRFEVFNNSLKVPILFLIVATFGFVFSAVVYSNMTGSTRISEQTGEDYIKTGNVLSEYLGLYPFIASIPMVVAAITTDSFLRYSTLVITLASIVLYTPSRYSLLRRGFRSITVTILALVIVSIIVGAALTQNTHEKVFNLLGLMFLLLMAVLAFAQSHKI